MPEATMTTLQLMDRMLRLIEQHAEAMGMRREDIGRSMILHGLCIEADRSGPAAVSAWLHDISMRFQECEQARPTSH